MVTSYVIRQGLPQAIHKADDGRGVFFADYMQVCVDRRSGRVFGTHHHGIGRTGRTTYDDSAIITVDCYAGPLTCAELVKDVETAVAMTPGSSAYGIGRR